MQKAHDSSKNNSWKNYPDITTPILAEELNRNETSVDTIDDRVVTMDTTKANQTDLLTCISDITYNSTNGKFTITKKNGNTVEIDTNLEKLAVNFDYDDDPTSQHYQQLIVTLDDGTVKYVDLSALITEYEFTTSSVIQFTVSSGSVSATILNGSITETMLETNFLANCRAAKNGADASALVSEGWAKGTQNGQAVGSESPYYNNNAEYFKNQAQAAATPTTDLVKRMDIAGAKNWLHFPYADGMSKTQGNVTFTVYNDGSVKITATGTVDQYTGFVLNGVNDIDFDSASSAYKMTGVPTVPGVNGLRFGYWDGVGSGYYGTDSNNGLIPINGKFDPTQYPNQHTFISLDVGSVVPAEGIMIYPMLMLETDTDSGYRPYAKTNVQLTKKLDNLAASDINGGTFKGQVNANATAMASLTTAQLRDATISTQNLTAGTSQLAAGVIYLQYTM